MSSRTNEQTHENESLRDAGLRVRRVERAELLAARRELQEARDEATAAHHDGQVGRKIHAAEVGRRDLVKHQAQGPTRAAKEVGEGHASGDGQHSITRKGGTVAVLDVYSVSLIKVWIGGGPA